MMIISLLIIFIFYYTLIGILFTLIQSLLFKITNRYSGNGFFEIAWYYSLLISIFLWFLWVPSAFLDWKNFYKRYYGRKKGE